MFLACLDVLDFSLVVCGKKEDCGMLQDTVAVMYYLRYELTSCFSFNDGHLRYTGIILVASSLWFDFSDRLQALLYLLNLRSEL